MKVAFRAFIALFSSWVISGCENSTSSFTLKEDKVILQTPKGTTLYQINRVPGYSTIKFDKKSVVQNDQETNISEVTLENQINGKKFILVESKPIQVIWDGETSIWTPSFNK